jgi:type I restriction enzyme S subunit
LVINTEPMATNQGCKGLIPGSQLHHKYLYYYLSSIVDLLNSLGTGATFKELSGGKLKEVTIPVPPLPEQQRIVGILDEAFDGITTAKANAEKNLQNARAIFESHLQTVFTQRGKGWTEKRLGEVLQKTKTINPRQSPETEFDYIDVSSVSNSTFHIEQTQRLKGIDAPSRARKLVMANDVLFATVRPTLKRIAIVPEHLDNQVCSTGYFVLRPKAGVDHRYIFYSLFTEGFMGAMEKLQKGASYPAVTDGEVRSQLIPIPPFPDQQRIVGILDKLTKDTRRLESIYQRKLAALEELKKSLLHKAFSGEL